MSQQISIPTIPFAIIERNEPVKVDFETILTAAFNESLLAFGESIPQIVYSQLENKFYIRKEEVPHKIEAFVSAIESIFGESALLVETKIMENLHGKIRGFAYKTPKKELFFADYLATLKKYLD